MTAFLLPIYNLRVDPDRGRQRDHDRLKEIIERFTERFGSPKIRCPLCAWEPSREDRWSCTCDFTWHTFDTGGVCPACDYQWLETMCFQCHEWSQHTAWYVDDSDDAE